MLVVGRVIRPHGLAGELVVALSTDRPERHAPGAVFSTPRGPLTIEGARPHQGRWLMRFAEVPDRAAAESWRQVDLEAEPLDDTDELWVHELIGCTVFTPDGVERGRVEAVQDNPAADLLVLDSGSLVPVVFIVGDPRDGRIEVDTPPGLFDL